MKKASHWVIKAAGDQIDIFDHMGGCRTVPSRLVRDMGDILIDGCEKVADVRVGQRLLSASAGMTTLLSPEDMDMVVGKIKTAMKSPLLMEPPKIKLKLVTNKDILAAIRARAGEQKIKDGEAPVVKTAASPNQSNNKVILANILAKRRRRKEETPAPAPIPEEGSTEVKVDTMEKKAGIWSMLTKTPTRKAMTYATLGTGGGAAVGHVENRNHPDWSPELKHANLLYSMLGGLATGITAPVAGTLPGKLALGGELAVMFPARQQFLRRAHLDAKQLEAVKDTSAAARAQAAASADTSKAVNAQTELARESAKHTASSDKWRNIAGGGMALGAGGVGLYSVYKLIQELMERRKERRTGPEGKLRVNLPSQTGKDTMVEFPANELPEYMYKGLMRDMRKQLREQVEGGKKHRLAEPAEQLV